MRFANGRFSIVEKMSHQLFVRKDGKRVEFQFPPEKHFALVRHDLRAEWQHLIVLGPSHVLIDCYRTADNAYRTITGILLGGWLDEHDE